MRAIPEIRAAFLARLAGGQVAGIGRSTGVVLAYVTCAALSAVPAGAGAQSASDIVGGWFFSPGGPGTVTGTVSIDVWTFTSGGKYYQGEDTKADATGRPGMEYGTYTWNPASGAFSSTTTFDTNGDFGFSSGTCTKATVSGNALTLTCPDQASPTTVYVLTRATSSVSPIVGSWYVASGPTNDDRIFTFMADGTYVSVGNESSLRDPTVTRGIERGTYTWNATTGALTYTTTVNTDGQGGFSHSICNKAVVSGDILTLTCADTSSPTSFASFTASRIGSVAAAATTPTASTTSPTATTPLPVPPAAQSAYTVSSGRLPTDAITVDTRSSTFGNATLVVTLDLSRVLAGGSFAGAGTFAAGYNVYVVALVPGAVLGQASPALFMLPAPPGTWAALSSPIAAYMSGIAANATSKVEIAILQNLNIVSLAGTEFYVGYGLDSNEMLTAGRYRGVYKAQ